MGEGHAREIVTSSVAEHCIFLSWSALHTSWDQEQQDSLVEQLQRDPVDVQVYSEKASYRYIEYIKNNQHSPKSLSQVFWGDVWVSGCTPRNVGHLGSMVQLLHTSLRVSVAS